MKTKQLKNKATTAGSSKTSQPSKKRKRKIRDSPPPSSTKEPFLIESDSDEDVNFIL